MYDLQPLYIVTPWGTFLEQPLLFNMLNTIKEIQNYPEFEISVRIFKKYFSNYFSLPDFFYTLINQRPIRLTTDQ